MTPQQAAAVVGEASQLVEQWITRTGHGRRALTTLPSGALDFDRVSFWYDAEREFALEDVSFRIPFGKTTAIVGTSGSGKTTLATRLAVRLAQLMPQRIALLDLDLFFDDAALQLDLNPSMSLASAAAEHLQELDPHTLNRYLSDHPSSLRVLIGATNPNLSRSCW